MSELINQGFYLMFVGMSFVLCFLTLVVIALNVLAKFAAADEPATKVIDQGNKPDSNKQLMAVIGAAIHKYRTEQN